MTVTKPSTCPAMATDSAMNLDIDLQIACDGHAVPSAPQFSRWVAQALQEAEYDATGDIPTELTLRIVDSRESQTLNMTYRGKDRSTNVLSFPFEAPEDIPLALLGDLIICAPVVEQEAAEQNKALEAHWAHMVIHGTLHLLGYDHIDEQDAEIMETLEVQTLANLGFADPYVIDNEQRSDNRHHERRP